MFQNIEGIRAVTEAINFGVKIDTLFIADYVQTSKKITYLLKTAKKKNIKVIKVNKEKVNSISKTNVHQGIIALAHAFKYKSLEDVLQKTKNKDKSLIIILDHIQDAGNLGAIARSAAAFNSDAIIIPNKRAASVTDSTYKTSAGAICKMNTVLVTNLSATIDKLKKVGYWICCATEHSDNIIWNSNLKGKIALVCGNEHNGISKLILQNTDFCAKLPIKNIESINVAQAATACMYEWCRQNTQ